MHNDYFNLATEIFKIFIGAGLGALIVAHYAFLYERKSKKDDECELSSASLRKSQFVLYIIMLDILKVGSFRKNGVSFEADVIFKKIFSILCTQKIIEAHNHPLDNAKT